jgi:purine nucleoside phosphorylase
MLQVGIKRLQERRVLLDDHINLQGGSPLSGLNSFEYGGIFPDMSAPYDEKLNISTNRKLVK